ncbi:homoserine dehydrogenase [Litorimonas sp. RW-G-Af-16]|uniref:homoserine dehydrogenase n=1 Tax=Litorimonas sp. RW-G-Af-16 TaxID=3241168 RepID=UPI00390CCA8E
MPVPVIVLNFGHSVLNSLDDYTRAAAEIYRHYRQGQNVVAVTSAQSDQTDILLAEARNIGPEGQAKNLPELLQLGERRSAALLALALERIGAPAFVRQARDLGLTGRGSYMDAELTGLNTDQLLADLKAHDIVVMPGFVAIGEKDRPVLLGQGGADLTALYVADKLGVEAVLLKDVDGVYDRDPRQSGTAPLRYEHISYNDAAVKAAPLIAPKALAFAKANNMTFRLGRPGLPRFTKIGDKTGPLSPAPKVKKLRVAMLGCGIVGGGVFRQIEANPQHFDLVKIMVRNVDKYIDQGYAPSLLTTSAKDLFDAKPDIFIDVSGPIDPALKMTEDMLKAGVHVVSANKQAIAAGGQDLIDLATKHNVKLLFSSAAGGGMPVLEMCLREAGRITRVEALLNGTTNYMLGEMDKGKSYAEALKEAQDKGFAEADPTADVGGADAAAKIRLIALLAFGEQLTLNDIPRETIENFAPNEPPKGIMKRVATVWRDKNGFSATLELRDLSPNNFIAQADGEEAHAIFEFSDGDEYRIRGKGAGRWPTTASVMADMFDISAVYLN